MASTRLRVGANLVQETPKSGASRRTLPLPEHLAATLKSARATQAADRLALGEAYEASGHVVSTRTGRR